MVQISQMRTHSQFRRVISFGGAIALLVTLSPSSFADRDRRPQDPFIQGGPRAYTPPEDLTRPGDDHTGGGVRGCGDDIAALAPRLNFVGQTAATQPTFVWYNFSDDGDPIEFQLYRYKADGSFETVVEEQFDESQQGYMAYTLPADEALDTGEIYLWQVVLYCDQEFEQPGQYSSADIEVVSLPADLAARLPDDSLARAEVYAQSGLWYEAMAEVYDAETPAEANFRRSLLLDLADYEAQSEKDGATALSEQLIQIAEAE